MWQMVLAWIVFGFVGASVGYVLAKIRSGLEKIEGNLAAVNVLVDIYLPAIHREIMQLKNEVETVKTMLQLQDIRNRQQQSQQQISEDEGTGG